MVPSCRGKEKFELEKEGCAESRAKLETGMWYFGCIHMLILQSANTSGTCVRDLLVASRTGRAARSCDIEVSFIGKKNVCCGHDVSLHPSGYCNTGITLRVRSVGYVSSLHPAV